jgi:phosphoribosylglycinamide formyltransferase 2
MSVKVLMLGAGELGKEVVVEFKRLGCFVATADRYEGAPASQVADVSFVLDMTNSEALSRLIREVQPDYVVPEIEAIATEALSPAQGATSKYDTATKIVPSFSAVSLTMHREGIRRLAADKLGLKTSQFRFANSEDELLRAAGELGYPVVVKPVQSSSGKGQSVAKTETDVAHSWKVSQTEARGGGDGVQRVIVEEFVDFDFEITLLTCKSSSGIVYCEPIGHHQVSGDYRTSWQPQKMSEIALEKAQTIAKTVVEALTPGPHDYGLFGVELFIKGDDVIFSEVSPRPHDTGMVTLISQDYSEFEMHARAVLGIPVRQPKLLGPSASEAIIAEGFGTPEVTNLPAALENVSADDDLNIRVFGKPTVQGERRVAVVLARSTSTEEALANVRHSAAELSVEVK